MSKHDNDDKRPAEKPEKRHGEDMSDSAKSRTPSSPNDGKPFRKEETGATEGGNEDKGAKR